MRSAFARGLSTATRPWSVQELTAAGVKPSTLRGPRWRCTSRGWYVPAGTPTSAAQRILDAGPLVPRSGALSGWAAAYVLGVDWLDGLDPFTMAEQPVVISLGRDAGRTSTMSVRYTRDRLPAQHRLQRFGLSVTTPERTAFDGARRAPDLTEAVVFLDQVGHALSLNGIDLHSWCAPGGWWGGVNQVREALTWMDPRSASPWETRLRMFYQQQAGLPRPEVNVPIFSREGSLLGIADLLDEEAGFVTEFDGKGHRLREQHRSDNWREEGLEGTNLVVSRVDSLDLRQPARLAERLRARRAQGLQRDRRLDSWTLIQPEWWRRRRAS